MGRICFILIIGLACTISQEWLTIGSFKVHQGEISSKWCVEADNPGNCCQGRCWLTRILDDIHNHESEEGVLQELNDQQEFLPSWAALSLGMNSQYNSRSYTWNPPKDHKRPYKVFHPPKA